MKEKQYRILIELDLFVFVEGECCEVAFFVRDF